MCRNSWCTCRCSLTCRSAAASGSWASPSLRRSRMARWFACGAPHMPCQCTGRTAARECSWEERGQRTSSAPYCTLVGYRAQSVLTAECRMTRIPCEACDTSHLCYMPWQHPGSGSLLLPQTLKGNGKMKQELKSFFHRCRLRKSNPRQSL